MKFQDSAESKTYLYRFGRFELDEAHLLFKQDGVVIPLSAKPWSLLLLLLQHAPAVVSHKQIYDSVWHQRTASVGVLTQIVIRLRQALHDDDQALIKNVHGIGFCFAGDLEREVQTADRKTGFGEISTSTKLRGRQPWRLVQALNTGGNTAVWLGEHSSTHEQRAFKFAFDATGKSNLKREVFASSLLADSREGGFLRVLHWDFTEVPYFIEIHYVAGSTLEEWVGQQWDCASEAFEQRALALLGTVADVLAGAHAMGVVHGDLSAKNVLIQQDGLEECAWLSDFGSAQVSSAERIRALELSIPMTGGSAGPHSSALIYAAPELLQGGSVSEASDVYALGVLVFQVLARDARKPLTPGWEQFVSDPILRADVLVFCAPQPVDRPTALEARERIAQLPSRRAAHAAQLALAEQRRLNLLNRTRRRQHFLIMMVLGAAVVVAATGWLRAIDQQEQARANMRLAHRNAKKAETLLLYLGNAVYAEAEPGTGVAKDMTVADALWHSFHKAERELRGDTDLQLGLYTQFAQTFLGMGEYERVAEVVARIYRLPGVTPEIDTTLQYTYAESLYLKGQFVEAGSRLRAVLARLRTQPDEAANVYIRLCLIYLAEIEITNGQLEQGKSLLDQLRLPTVDVGDALGLSMLNGRDTWMGRYFEAKGEWPSAERHFLAIEQRTAGRAELSPNQTVPRFRARQEAARGNFAAAITRMETAIAEIYRRLGPTGPQHIAELELARILADGGETERSIALLKRLLDPKQTTGRFGQVYQERARQLLKSLSPNASL